MESPIGIAHLQLMWSLLTLAQLKISVQSAGSQPLCNLYKCCLIPKLIETNYPQPCTLNSKTYLRSYIVIFFLTTVWSQCGCHWSYLPVWISNEYTGLSICWTNSR